MNSSSSPPEIPQNEDEKALKALAEIFMEHLKQQVTHLEPFEAYVQRLKINLYQNSNHFYERFINGYRILTQEVKEMPPLPPQVKKPSEE